MQLCGKNSSQAVCHDDVRYFVVSILDMSLQGSFPPFQAKEDLPLQRHSFDVMDVFLKSLANVCVLAFVVS